MVRGRLFVIENFQYLVKIDEDQWVYDNIMSKEVDINEQKEDEVKSEHIECSGTFNTFQYMARKKDLVRTNTDSRKCKLRGKLVVGSQGWMVKLMCESHNHEMENSLVGHPYVGRLTKDKQIIIANMTKSMYIHWHRLKDEDVVRDIFWCHPNAVKLCNACNLVFLIDSTYKTNRCWLQLLDFVGVTPIGMTFSIGFSYLEGEHLNNVVWDLERFRGLFLRRDVLPEVIVADKDLALMNAVKIVFPKCTNLLCQFHIDKNVKAKCKSPEEFDEWLEKFEINCSPWLMFVDYVNQIWIIPHREKFVKAWTNTVMYLGNTTTNRLLQNSLGDLCSVWKVINNMIILQHIEIKAFFETSTHVVEHVQIK
ncbi:Protein FAR1-RELATED SEQUENCE 6 [Glycine soja]